MRISFLFLACVALTISGRGAAESPNIVLIFTDDQGYGDVGCFGSKTIRTPNLDQLAEEGMRFTDFYCMAPVCSASRTGLLTGRYPVRTGITGVLFPRHKVGLPPEESTLAEVLKTVGYATACIGKWHLGHLPEFLPTSQGFDTYFGIPYSNDMDKVPGKKNNLDENWRNRDFSTWNVPLMRDETIIERPADQNTLTKRYTEESIRFIEKSKDGRFFLYLPHTMPHIPLFVSTEFHASDPNAAYRATIEELDWTVGEILGALKEHGLERDTLVIFTTDNGPWLGMKHHGGSSGGLRGGKFGVYEGGMRVPTIMRWPGRIPANSTCGKVAATFDILPTVAEITGASLPAKPIDGRSFLRLLEGDPDAPSPHADGFCFFKGKNIKAIRRGKWKAHLGNPKKNEAKEGAGPRVLELYDLSADIAEAKNLVDRHPEVAEKLLAEVAKVNAGIVAEAGKE